MAKKQKALPKKGEVTKRRLARWQQERRRRRITILIGALVIVAVVAIILVGVLATTNSQSGKLLSTVNGTNIHGSDYLKALRLSSYNLAEFVLSGLENNELVRQGTVTFGINVTDDEITDYTKASLFPGVEEVSEEEFEESYQQLLDGYGVSDTEFRHFVEAELLQSRLTEHMTGQVPETALQVHVHGILVASEEEALDGLVRLESGDDFAELALEISIDETSRENEISGHLGWFPRGIMADDFEEIAFGLEPGAVSEPFFSSEGYWILWVLEREDNRPLEEEAKQQLGLVAFGDWIEEQTEQKVERVVDANELNEVHEWAIDKIG